MLGPSSHGSAKTTVAALLLELGTFFNLIACNWGNDCHYSKNNPKSIPSPLLRSARMDCCSLFHSVGLSVVVFLGSILPNSGTGLFYGLISTFREQEGARWCVHVLLWVGRGEALARAQTSQVGGAKALSFLTKFCSSSWINFFSAEPTLCRVRVSHVPSDNWLVFPPQVHLAASMVTFPTRTISGQDQHHRKAELRAKSPHSWVGAEAARDALCLWGKLTGGDLRGSACSLPHFPSSIWRARRSGAGKAPLLWGSGSCPGSTWWTPGRFARACTLLVFPWVTVWEGTPGSTDHVTPLFSLTCSCSSSVFGAGMLRRARKRVCSMKRAAEFWEGRWLWPCLQLQALLWGERFSSSLVSSWLRVSVTPVLVSRNSLPWEKWDGLKGWEWMRAYLLLAGAWIVCLQADGKSILTGALVHVQKPAKVLNSTVYLQRCLINKKQEFTWESLYLMAKRRVCGKWKSWDLRIRSSTYAEQTSYSKGLVLWKWGYEELSPIFLFAFLAEHTLSRKMSVP